jgi:hypothetical protein
VGHHTDRSPYSFCTGVGAVRQGEGMHRIKVPCRSHAFNVAHPSRPVAAWPGSHWTQVPLRDSPRPLFHTANHVSREVGPAMSCRCGRRCTRAALGIMGMHVQARSSSAGLGGLPPTAECPTGDTPRCACRQVCLSSGLYVDLGPPYACLIPTTPASRPFAPQAPRGDEDAGSVGGKNPVCRP